MNKKLRRMINRIFGWIYMPYRRKMWVKVMRKRNSLLMNHFQRDIDKIESGDKCIYYLGITAHSNLGDMAQYYCILRWIKKNYADRKLVEVESDLVVDKEQKFIELFKKTFKKDDIIVFQSGYTTQDLGGNHEEMHRLICDEMSDAHILMMPQTIFFRGELNRQRTAQSYSQAHNMLFLARDMVSYEQAIQMFSSIKVMPFPDIVTSLIGTFKFNNKRKGVCMCVRDDGEKFYSDKELFLLRKRLKKHTEVVVTDTTIQKSFEQIRVNLQNEIESVIEKYSHYDCVITDRYHGTIFSLAAGTPVIIIKTNDHKVTTGADWFKGIYDEYVYVAQDLNEAYNIYQKIMSQPHTYNLIPYFENKYYGKLKDYFESINSKR